MVLLHSLLMLSLNLLIIIELGDIISNLLNNFLVDATKYYFTNRVVIVWNSLPYHIVGSPTLETFKSRLQKRDFSSHLIVNQSINK